VVLFRFSEGKRLLIEKVQEEYPVNDYILSIFLNAENNMKKLYFVAVAVLLLSSFSFGEVVGDTESMAPGDVNIFVKTRHIGRLLKSANYIVYHIMDEENRNQFLAEKDSFRDKTGIDYLDEESLKKFGVDTSRAISFAMYDTDNSRDVILFFIPVFNEQEFVQNFIETVKKTNAADGGQEISPVTTKYRGVSVTQIKKDAFAAAYGGYFIMASTDDILRKSIDVREERKGSLILTAEYRDYISKDKNNYDLNAFITRKFIEQQYPASMLPKGKDTVQGRRGISSLYRGRLLIRKPLTGKLFSSLLTMFQPGWDLTVINSSLTGLLNLQVIILMLICFWVFLKPERTENPFTCRARIQQYFFP